MADPDDAAVDRVIEQLQKALDSLKSSQAKDEADEEQPSDLKEAAVRVREHFRRRRAEEK